MTGTYKLLVIIFLILSPCDIKCCTSIVSISVHNSKLPAIICNSVKGIVGNDKQISTASVTILRNNFELSQIDEVIKCIPKKLSVTVADFRSERSHIKSNGRKAMIEIVIADEIGMLKIKKLISTEALNTMAKFLIVTSSSDSQARQIASSFFPQVGIVNFGVYYEKDSQVYVETSNHFTNSSLKLDLKSQNVSIKPFKRALWKELSNRIFPDKLKNLNGYSFQILYHHGMSYAHYNDKLVAMNKYFFDSVANMSNAAVNYIIVNSTDPRDIQEKLESLKRNRQIDVTLSSSLLSNLTFTKIMTYTEKATCVMIPNNMRNDNIVWHIGFLTGQGVWRFIIIITTVLFLLVWRLYRNRGAVDSVKHILFLFHAFYVGQAVKFSRNNRRILVIMLQCIILSMVIIKSINECKITSIAFQTKSTGKFESIDDILKHRGLNISVGVGTEDLLEYLQNHQANLEDYKYAAIDGYGQEHGKLSTVNIIVGQCDFLDHYIRRTTSSTHYILPQRFFSYFIMLDVRPSHPLTERLQEMMNFAFDSGLTQKWYILYLSELFGSKTEDLKYYSDDKSPGQMIGFNELDLAYWHIIGIYSVATIIFLFEIFWHSFLSKLSWTLIMRICRSRQSNEPKRWESLGRIQRKIHFWRQRRIMNVRRIQVRPIDI